MKSLLTTRLSPHGGALLPAVTFAPPNANSLGGWVQLYWQTRVVGSPEKTATAKRQDLARFLRFFAEALGHDHVDGWTPAVTKGFQMALTQTVSAQSAKPLKATTTNRVMATLRHFARWLHQQRPLLAGNPLEGVKDIGAPEELHACQSRPVNGNGCAVPAAAHGTARA